eukprot:CAMPEP_0183326494 /NCGR_PEP_ID=MMETSP0160_2-20130417/82320_1 /TAXON_ID=2839 ORGANISM="Odontella Sinensis, Strain Grunow 1884" /NCGR_SAMPLE_ID=MMETSP0160_2 /ASSEMBLY_ACC=CAM_ASM_000250 /LENGTH=93 /DNA_ID=CAMNT_0025494489 /DNA_START=21 /DNA_END=299 /DNA_ORIENTATION=-
MSPASPDDVRIATETEIATKREVETTPGKVTDETAPTTAANGGSGEMARTVVIPSRESLLASWGSDRVEFAAASSLPRADETEEEALAHGAAF